MKGLRVSVSDSPGPVASITRAKGAQISPFLLSALTSSRRQEKFSSDTGGRGGYVPGKQGDCCAQRSPCGSRSGCQRRVVGLVLTPLHSPLEGVEECGQPGTVVHDEGTALRSLCGDAVVLQVQGDLRAGRSHSPGCSAEIHSVPTACQSWLHASYCPT